MRVFNYLVVKVIVVKKTVALEYALVSLRDSLVYNLLLSAQAIDFTSEQIDQIISFISYEREIPNTKRFDADICRYTIDVINELHKNSNDDSVRNLYEKRLLQLERLITKIPEMVNKNAKINQEQYLFDAGSSWPIAMTEMLQSRQILDIKQKTKLQLLATIWNFRITKLFLPTSSMSQAVKITVKYLVPTELLGEISQQQNDPDFPKEYKNDIPNLYLKLQSLYGYLSNVSEFGNDAYLKIMANMQTKSSPANRKGSYHKGSFSGNPNIILSGSRKNLEIDTSNPWRSRE